MKELKPCPFCGGEAELKTSDYFAYVTCKKCEASTCIIFDSGSSMHRVKDEVAIEAWNRRIENEMRTNDDDYSEDYCVSSPPFAWDSSDEGWVKK